MKTGLMRSYGSIRRESTARGAFASVGPVHPEVGTAWVEIRPPKMMLDTFGAGEQPEGSMELETHEAVDLQTRDLFVVMAGPQSDTTWKVISVHRPGNGPLFATLQLYTGTVNEPPP